MPRLENWSTALEPHQAPEVARLCLAGDVHEDPRFPAGSHILTSPLVNEDFLEAGVGRTEKGTTYVLGKPDPKYLAYLEAGGFESFHKVKALS